VIGGRVTAHEVSATSDVPLASASMPTGLQVSRWIWVGGRRVAMAAHDERFSRFLVGVVDFGTGQLAVLAEGEGPPPNLGTLTGGKLLLGWLGRNLVTDDTAWRAIAFGESSWEAIDAREDTVLVRVGSGPRADAYLVARISDDSVRALPLVVTAEGFLLSPTRLDTRPLSALYVTVAAPDTAMLWRTAPDSASPVLKVAGQPVTFGAGGDSVALATQSADGDVRLVIDGPPGRSEVILARSAARSGGAVIFAGRDLAIALGRPEGGFDAYLVGAGPITPVGDLLPIAPLSVCNG
jgi:hypothetical protein